MKVINTTRAMGTSLIALGVAVGFAHEAAASKVKGLYTAKEICKVSVSEVPPNGGDPVPVKVFGTHVEYSVKIETVKDSKSSACDFSAEAPSSPEGLTLEGVPCVDVKAYFVSKDNKRKYLYRGTAYYGPPTYDDDYKAVSMTAMELEQCYGFDDNDYVVTYSPKEYEYLGHGRYNFIGHGFIPDPQTGASISVAEDEDEPIIEEDCKVLLVKSREKDVRKHIKKADLPENFFCGADFPPNS